MEGLKPLTVFNAQAKPKLGIGLGHDSSAITLQQPQPHKNNVLPEAAKPGWCPATNSPQEIVSKQWGRRSPHFKKLQDKETPSPKYSQAECIITFILERPNYTRMLQVVKTYNRIRKLGKLARKLIKHLDIYFSSPRT